MTKPAMALIFLLIACLVAIPACTDQQPAPTPTPTPGADDSAYVTSFDTADLASQLASYPTGTLSPEEEADIRYMAEEEKLARDVYLALYGKWNARVFANIGDAEETHMQSILVLAERYDLATPVQDAPGAFNDPQLQVLYTGLVAQGAVSLSAAFRVGALIEEIDIVDLQDAIARTDQQDTTFVYENLMRGSRNHLRAFVRNLERQGETYEPQELPLGEYEMIVSGGVETGGFG